MHRVLVGNHILKPFTVSCAMFKGHSLSAHTSLRQTTVTRHLRLTATCARSRLHIYNMSSPSAADQYYKYGLKTLSPESTMQKTIARLGPELKEVPLEASKYIKPRSVLYTMDGKERRWDVVESHPSVGIVLYHSDEDAFIIVRQFRPAVYIAQSREARAAGRPAPALSAGFTHELCAGLVDKPDLSLAAIAAEEVAEECGYQVAPEQLKELASSVSSAGTAGTLHTVFYGRIDNSMRMGDGGGLAHTGESIEVLALPFDQAPAFVLDNSLAKSPGLQFGLLWAYHALSSGQVPDRKKGAMETDALTLKPVACA